MKNDNVIFEDGFDKEGYDEDGFDKEGYDRFGYGRHGYDKDGYDSEGFNRDGFNRQGFDKYGYDIDGYNSLGFDEDGFNREGFNRDGLNKDGYDIYGYNLLGFDEDGFNREGFDRFGFDRKGFNKEGYNRFGENYFEIFFKKNASVDECFTLESEDIKKLFSNLYNIDAEEKFGFIMKKTGIILSTYFVNKNVLICTVDEFKGDCEDFNINIPKAFIKYLLEILEKEYSIPVKICLSKDRKSIYFIIRKKIIGCDLPEGFQFEDISDLIKKYNEGKSFINNIVVSGMFA